MIDSKPGGWIASRPYRLGVGPVATASRVCEPAGYTGDKLTIYDPDGHPKWVVRFSRGDRTVFPTKREAIAAAKNSIKED